MKFQELTSEELKTVNGGLLGGLLGLNRRGTSSSQASLIGNIGINLNLSSTSQEGDQSSLNVGLSLSDIGIFSSTSSQ
ncbi:bacteriocin [Belliella kenyensis]|uniref:Bacteriocin n=1 Tax=Belliella kenyensis TaxID=1472724 RepID=A0ABV8EH82_9BACT|nr:bacteriocin [Belliella kenyensis]MCH7401174.1 bacteriocin [Belliella kenyensis]MDN3604171.1 bacteriocin [Belliella kenyensis]